MYTLLHVRLPTPPPPTNASKIELQMRHRVVEAPLGRKVGYHELGDEAEEADVEWMTGEASQVSGGGVRGSRNWCLMIVFPIFVSYTQYHCLLRMIGGNVLNFGGNVPHFRGCCIRLLEFPTFEDTRYFGSIVPDFGCTRIFAIGPLSLWG